MSTYKTGKHVNKNEIMWGDKYKHNFTITQPNPPTFFPVQSWSQESDCNVHVIQ